MIDLDAFSVELLDTDAFAQLASYTRQGYASAQIPVIFENEFISAQGLGIVGVESSAPQAICKTADVPNVSHGDTLVIGGTTYNVIEVMPDGTGITVVRLSRD